MNHPPEFLHDPVMLDEIVAVASSLPTGAFADLTLGGAGHAHAILHAREDMNLHGFDRDADALAAASKRLESFGDRITTHRTRFDAAPGVLREHAATPISGFLMDLGVSSPQLDWAERGFSYRLDGPLDMRMDGRQTKNASNVVNDYSPGELIDVLRSYGDERHARRIVEAIVANRPIATTTELARTIADALPAAARRKSSGHPAKRSFQAIRIEVNDELSILGDTVKAMTELLAPGGVGLVLTYHSGEDRIVKDRMRRIIDRGALPGMPATSGFDWHWRGARTPSDGEIEQNPRARSARLRAITRLERA